MRDEEMDRILSAAGPIRPSAAFTASVMSAVRSEAGAPPAFPFPWRRALPGLVAGCAMVGTFVISAIRDGHAAPAPATPLVDSALAFAATLAGPEPAWTLGASLLLIATITVAFRVLAADEGA